MHEPVTSTWRQRFAKAKHHIVHGNPQALWDETRQYLYWKGVLKPEQEPEPEPVVEAAPEVRRPTEEEFWDEVDIEVSRSVAWLAACNGVLGAWAQAELLGHGTLESRLPDLLGEECHRLPKHALVLGCGDMRSEHNLLIHPAVQFDRIDAYDVSTQSMLRAAEFTESLGLNVNYQVGDANTMELPANEYSLVMCYFAYHHFRDVERVAAQIAKTLTNDGIFVTIDYVGPPRLQYSQDQLFWAHHLLKTLPDRYRKEISGLTRTEIHSMPLDMISPDEAPCSDQILAAFDRHLDVTHQYNWAGLLYPLLEGIGGNFADTPEDRKLVRFFFDLDKLLVASGQVEPNYTMTVARKPQ